MRVGARHAGTIVELLGEGADPETGPLPAITLVWTVEMHHHAEGSRQHHVHPYAGPIFGAQAAFEVPAALHDDDIFFRVRLTATDADRLTNECGPRRASCALKRRPDQPQRSQRGSERAQREGAIR